MRILDGHEEGLKLYQPALLAAVQNAGTSIPAEMMRD